MGCTGRKHRLGTQKTNFEKDIHPPHNAKKKSNINLKIKIENFCKSYSKKIKKNKKKSFFFCFPIARAASAGG